VQPRTQLDKGSSAASAAHPTLGVFEDRCGDEPLCFTRVLLSCVVLQTTKMPLVFAGSELLEAAVQAWLRRCTHSQVACRPTHRPQWL
jgi:hypothetical protein